MTSIEELIERLDTIIDSASSVPFSKNKVMVDIVELQQIADEIRLNIPQEIRQARGIVGERADIITSANKEADEIINKATERARALVNQEEIYKRAVERAREILTAAQEKANEIERAAVDFSDSILLGTENSVNQSLEVIRQSRKRLRSAVQAEASARKASRSAPSEEEDETEE